MSLGLDDNLIREIAKKAFANLDWKAAVGQGISTPSLAVVKPTPDPETVEQQNWLKILHHPCTGIITGGRGKGKSAVGYRILEYLHWQAPVCVVGLPKAARKYLPDYVHMFATIEEVPPGYAVLVDEGYLGFHARRSMAEANVEISQIINLSRQRNQTIIVVTQEARQIDINIVSQTDILILKKPSMLQSKFERGPLRDLVEEANSAFLPISKKDVKKYSYVIADEAEFKGLMENSLPTFWHERLSHIFATGGTAVTIAGKIRTKAQRIEEAKEKAKALKAQGLSLGKSARIMKVTPPTIKNYLEDYPYKR